MGTKSLFTALILSWFDKNRRSFPWRTRTDPYQILIAEIMLQRTKADQVEPVYMDFIRRFPDVRKLNRATRKEIGEYFAQLGLFWRTELVKRLARELVERFDGKVPEDRDELLSLPAVGDYIADAVLSFAYGRDVAVVDSNVCRVLGRVFGLTAKGEARRDRRFRSLAQEIVPSGRAGEFNWAMIDFAAVVCTPRNPKHGTCPVNNFGTYYQTRARE